MLRWVRGYDTGQRRGCDPARAHGAAMTFSVVAHDSATGDLGVAVESKFLAVGSAVPHAAASVGAVATQALANLSYGPRGLELLSAGWSAADVLAELVGSDDRSDRRQVGIVDHD